MSYETKKADRETGANCIRWPLIVCFSGNVTVEKSFALSTQQMHEDKVY